MTPFFWASKTCAVKHRLLWSQEYIHTFSKIQLFPYKFVKSTVDLLKCLWLSVFSSMTEVYILFCIIYFQASGKLTSEFVCFNSVCSSWHWIWDIWCVLTNSVNKVMRLIQYKSVLTFKLQIDFVPFKIVPLGGCTPPETLFPLFVATLVVANRNRF